MAPGAAMTRQQAASNATQTRTQPPLILRLNLPNARENEGNEATNGENGSNQVQWDNSVVDNEGMNRKKSKKCCIFHKKRRFDESDSDHSDSDAHSDDEFNSRYPQFSRNSRENASNPPNNGKNGGNEGRNHHCTCGND